jgi:putative hydrolase of HD superfamily
MPGGRVKELLDAVLTLKHLDRAGWKRVGISSPESVAAHTWGVAWLVLALCPEDLDGALALRLAVIHDLAEARVGDITPHDGVSREDKAALEQAAIAELCEHRPDLAALWQQYEDQQSPEARFVHDCDRLDMALQALRYARERDVDTSEFLVSARREIHHPALLEILDAAEPASQG